MDSVQTKRLERFTWMERKKAIAQYWSEVAQEGTVRVTWIRENHISIRTGRPAGQKPQKGKRMLL